MNALVLSGGGSKGAYAGGLAQNLIEKNKKSYDLFIGTSTGALLAPFMLLDDFQKIKSAYLSVSQENIFSICPFTVSKKKKTIKINHINVLKSFMNGLVTFGDSHNLKELIENTFQRKDYEAVLKTNKELVVVVANLTLQTLEYKSIRDYDYEDFCEWIWISCNFVPFMSLVNKNGYDYADGSLGVSAAIEEAIRQGAQNIDAIILEVEQKNLNFPRVKNAFWLMVNMYNFTKNELEKQNIQVAKDFAKKKGVQLQCFYTPFRLTDNPLVFDKEEMEKWWELGYEREL